MLCISSYGAAAPWRRCAGRVRWRIGSSGAGALPPRRHGKRRVAVGLVMLCWLTLVAADESVLSLEDAVREAESVSPALAAARARADAMAQLAPQMGALPDPRVVLNVANLPVDSFELGADPMTQLQLGIVQDLPFPGKRGLRRDAATLEADAAVVDVDDLRQRLVRDVKLLWWQLFDVERALETVHGNQRLFEQLVETAQTKYAVGQGLQHDVLLAELELTALRDEALRLEEQRIHQQLRLNTLLNRDALTPVRLPQVIDTPLPEVLSVERLQQLALAEQAELRVLQTRLDAARLRRALAERERYPDFRLGAVYGQRAHHDDLASVQFSMSLPLYAGSKQHRAVDQRSAEALASRYALDDARNHVMAEVAMALAQYRRARDQLALYADGLLPQARQTVDAMLAGYQVNKVDFLDLVRAQTTLAEYQTQYWQVYSEAHRALARLVAAVGTEAVYE